HLGECLSILKNAWQSRERQVRSRFLHDVSCQFPLHSHIPVRLGSRAAQTRVVSQGQRQQRSSNIAWENSGRQQFCSLCPFFPLPCIPTHRRALPFHPALWRILKN